MRLQAAVEGRLSEQVDDEIAVAAGAVTRAARRTDGEMKSEIRGRVRRAYGDKIAKTWRGQVFPKRGESIKAAVFQFSKAPRLMQNLIDAGPIRSPEGNWLAIPTDAARRAIPKRLFHGRDRRGGELSAVAAVEKRFGRLRMVRPKGRNNRAYLVADAVRETTRKTKSGVKRGIGKARRLKSGKLSKGATTIVMFTLVPQVRRAGRLDYAATERKYLGVFLRRIDEEWPKGRRG